MKRTSRAPDSAGASHDLADACCETDIRFSFGYPLTELLLDGLPDSERALWATAFYAGLRM
jgi:hypothetical protein